MFEIGYIYYCESCGHKRCCFINGYLRTCECCHLRGLLCQSEISCEVIAIEGKCEDCSQSFVEEVLNVRSAKASNLSL